VDTQQFAPIGRDEALAKELGLTRQHVGIGYIGSFVPYEGLDVLLRAVAGLPDRVRAQVRLLWVGDGAALPDWLKLATELGMRDQVISVGRKPFDQMPAYYSLIDLCAYPRRGVEICEIISPLKPFEAMAMRKAVVVSAVRPLSEMVAHGQTGLVHTRDDAQSLATQLATLIENPALRERLAGAGYDFVHETRQWAHIAARISAQYKAM